MEESRGHRHMQQILKLILMLKRCEGRSVMMQPGCAIAGLLWPCRQLQGHVGQSCVCLTLPGSDSFTSPSGFLAA